MLRKLHKSCCIAEGDAEEAASDLLRSSTYLDMLHDARRNQAYAKAIKSAVEAVRGCSPILDIGTGTGLLALLAARCECRPLLGTSCLCQALTTHRNLSLLPVL